MINWFVGGAYSTVVYWYTRAFDYRYTVHIFNPDGSTGPRLAGYFLPRSIKDHDIWVLHPVGQYVPLAGRFPPLWAWLRWRFRIGR